MSTVHFRYTGDVDITIAALAGLTIGPRSRGRGVPWTVPVAEVLTPGEQALYSARLKSLGAQLITWDSDTLAELQDALTYQVKAHRDLLLEHTRFYTHAGKQFGIGLGTRSNLTALGELQGRGVASLPYVVTTHDERDSHSIANASDLNNMLGAALAAVEAERATCAAVVAAIMAGDAAAAQAAADAYLSTT